jgi:NADP-dependent 3-hydroxy acid dehydrogenase YdfG
LPVAIVTGASAGIGAALTRELARRGWKVGVVARRRAPLEALVAEIRGAGGAAEVATADVTDRAATEAAIAQLEAALGPCDLIVANAGGGAASSVHALPVDACLSVMRLNYDGVVHAVGAVLPGMLRRNAGHLAVVSSVAAFRGLPAQGAYSASKAAVTALFQSFRAELHGTGIAVTTIHPGFVATELTAKNRFAMPFLMSAERAARIIADGLAARRADVTFPWQMRWLFRLVVNPMPDWLYDRIVSGPGKRAAALQDRG